MVLELSAQGGVPREGERRGASEVVFYLGHGRRGVLSTAVSSSSTGSAALLSWRFRV